VSVARSLHRVYEAGPTAYAFHTSDAFFRCLKGPVGGGKTVACIMEGLMRSRKQAPDVDGVRRTRGAIIRNKYPELKSTTIKSWQEWVSDSVCPLVYDIPIRGTLRQALDDGTRMELEVVFLALDRPEDVAKLLSMELTWAFINECRESDEEIFKFLTGRVGRYPRTDNEKPGSGPTWWGIFADTNPPRTTQWLYRVFEEEVPPESFELFSQPPAVYYDSVQQVWVPSQDAENLRYLPANYYQQQIEGNTDDYIRVMLAGEYGMTLLGKPVFPQYSERDHVAKQPIVPDRGMPVILGFDFGLHPACIFAQVAKSGGLRILDELVPADEDLESFVLDYVNPLLHSKYAQYKVVAVGDPAARGRSGLDKRTPFDVLMAFGNIRCIPARTNNFIPRKEAVDYFLTRREGFLLDPRLTYLREAFGGGYVYGEIKGQKGRHKERPEKNHYSHGCFIAGTLVDTPTGPRAIEALAPGDEVCTPIGPRRVSAALGRRSTTLVEITLADGRRIVCTRNHPFVTSEGLVRADALQYSTILIPNQERASWAVRLFTRFKSLMVSLIIGKSKATIKPTSIPTV
jgi:hypothetical protein